MSSTGRKPKSVSAVRSDQHRTFLRRAIQLAAANVEQGRGGPFGALIVKNGAILAEGVNQVTSANDPTAHAEIAAIRAACAKVRSFELRGAVIYSSCEPCPMCLAAIHWARLDAVYFAASHNDAAAAGFDDSLIYRQFRLPAGERKLTAVRLLEEEGLRPFDLWRASATKIPY